MVDNTSLKSCYEEIRNNPGRYYAYVIKRSTGEPFYVGVGHRYRIGCHEREAKKADKHSHKLSILRSDEVTYEIVGWYETWDDAASEEIRLIALYGRRDLGTGILTNLTDGGEGAQGVKRTPEQREHLSRIRKGIEFSPEHKAALREALTPEIRAAAAQKAAEKLRGRKHTPEHNAAIGAGNKGRTASPETRQKLSETLTGRTHSAETIERMRDGALNRDPATRNLDGVRKWQAENREQVSQQVSARWEDPEFRERMSVSLRNAERDYSHRQDPEYRAGIAARAKARWADPEFKARVSDAIRAAKAAKKEAA